MTADRPDPEPPAAYPAARDPDDRTATAALSAAPPPPPTTDVPLDPPDRPGDLGRLGPYRVVRKLGQGGMGAVFLAVDTRLRRNVALKVMLPRFADSASARGRFLREARAAARVNHDNVVAVYEAAEANGVPYIAMPVLSGYPLDEYLKRHGPPTLPQLLRLGRETAEGLAAAHDLGLVHRDIKPANLWLEAPHGRVKILDFGLARPVEPDPGDSLAGSLTAVTGPGAVVGTPAYMSPEQAAGQPLDHRTDLFSLGTLLYRLATGKQPFTGPNATAVAIAVATQHPTPVRELNPGVPEPLADLIHRLLSKNPLGRPPTGHAVAAELAAVERALAAGDVSSVEAVPVATAVPEVVYVPIPVTGYDPLAAFEGFGDTPAVPPAPPAVRPGGGVWAAVVAVVAVAVAAAGVVFWPRAEAPPPPTDPEPTRPVRPPPPPTPDRVAAEWVLKRGGSVELADGTTVDAPAKLPRGPLHLAKVLGLPRESPLTDPDLDVFQRCWHLTHLHSSPLGGPDQSGVSDAGLAKLAGFPCADRLTELRLICRGVTDAGVAHLARFRNLRTLTLARAELSTVGVRRAAHLPVLDLLDLSDAALAPAALDGLDGSNVGYLSLRTRIPAGGLRVVRRMPALKVLRLDGSGVTDDEFAPLAGMTGLTTLTVARAQVTDRSAPVLATLTGLTELDLSALRVTDAGLAGLTPLRNLKQLNLMQTRVTDAGVPPPDAFPRLTALGLNGTAVTDAAVPRLAAREGLLSLDVQGTRITTPAAKRLVAALPKCAVLFAYDPKADPDRAAAEWVFAKGGALTDQNHRAISPPGPLPAGPLFVVDVRFAPHGAYWPTDADLDHFARLESLHALHVQASEWTDAGVDKLSRFPAAGRFVTLCLNSARITDAALAHLPRFPALEQFELTGTRVTDAGLGAVAGVPKLRRLELSRTGVSGAGVAHLRGAKLTTLALHTCPKVGDDATPHLAAIPTLTRVSLNGTGVTDAGLAPLAGLPALTQIDLRMTRVSMTGAKRLQAALPQCEVLFDYDPAADPDRLAAGWVFEKGGTVRAEGPDGNSVTTSRPAELPDGPVKLRSVAVPIRATDDDLDRLRDLLFLLSLDLAATSTHVTDAGVEKLAGFPFAAQLTSLKLSGPKVTAAGMDAVARFPRLREFATGHGPPVGAATGRLTALRELGAVSLCYGSADDASVPPLAALPDLIYLCLNGSSVTDEGLKAVAKFPKLGTLQLATTPVTDAGLPRVAAVKTLTHVYLKQTKVTIDGLRKLKAARPGLNIDSDFNEELAKPGPAE